MPKGKSAPSKAARTRAAAEFFTKQDRDGELGSGWIGAISAIAVGVDVALGDNLNTGGAIGVAVGAVGAYLVCDHFRTSRQESVSIGVAAGGLGVSLGTRAQAKLAREHSVEFSLQRFPSFATRVDSKPLFSLDDF